MSDDPYPPDPHKFPDPQRYATFLRHRQPNFKTHKTLGIAKTAIANKARGGVIPCHAYVYEYDFDAALWREVAHIPRDARLAENEWYATKVSSKQALGPSKASVDAAIESILKTSS